MPTNNLIRQLPMAGRANFLPYQIGASGKPELALPGILAGAVNAVTAPYRAMNPQQYPDFNTEQEAADFALNMMGGGTVFGRAPKNALGMNVWHGSPHKFDPTPLNDLGEFNAAKIGTGEGAQAYGMGHYTGEARATGEGYQNAGYGGFMLDGEVVHPTTTKGAKEYAAAALSRFPDKKEAMAWVGDSNMAKEVNAIIQKTKDFGENKGYLYKVDIPDEQIAKMLDWDKPLSEQTAEVQEILKRSGQVIDKNKTGADLVRGRPGTPSDEITSDLAAQGIPGVRYLDAGSRPNTNSIVGIQANLDKAIARLKDWQGNTSSLGESQRKVFSEQVASFRKILQDAQNNPATSNFVVFPGNEHMMTILERNGQAMSPESQAIARYREIKGPKSVVRMEAALRTAGVPLPKNEPVAYIQRLVDQAHRRN